MDTLFSSTGSILSAMEQLDKSAQQILLVVDENMRLLGTVTDGDIRRGILNAVSIDQPVYEIMNTHCLTTNAEQARESLLGTMSAKGVMQIPVVSSSGVVIGLETFGDLTDSVKTRDNWVVLMAGGLGTRLKRLTKNTPKPMLKVGTKPIIETIINSFTEHGFKKFFISINYKAEVLKDYFGDGSNWGVEIRYLEEEKRAGTAGALALIEEKFEHPLLVMNADLLTKVNFGTLLDYHQESGADATMCVREYDLEVPFGVVKIEDDNISHIHEKPVQTFFVNAGIYVLDPGILQHVKPNTYLDMPHLFEILLQADLNAKAFPITEYWLDVGSMKNYEQANEDFGLQFC